MRFALGVEYDGSGYVGWQRQSEGRTVQASVEQALSSVANEAVHVVCAGRTDTGVHATGQVVHFDTDAERPEHNWLRGSNANLPDDIGVQWITAVSEDFHARFSATRRHYRYVIYTHEARPALLRDQVCWQSRPLDEARMAQGARTLLGEHDFTSFRATACQHTNINTSRRRHTRNFNERRRKSSNPCITRTGINPKDRKLILGHLSVIISIVSLELEGSKRFHLFNNPITLSCKRIGFTVTQMNEIKR